MDDNSRQNAELFFFSPKADNLILCCCFSLLRQPLPFGRVNDTLPQQDQLPDPFPLDLKFNSAHPEITPALTKDMEQAVKDMIEVLGDSVRRRVQDIPRTG